MRREVLTILAITTLVIALVAIIGPSMMQISTIEPTHANSIPIWTPEPKWNPYRDPAPETPPLLAFEITDAVTGARIERAATVELRSEGGGLIEIERGRADGEAITFKELSPNLLFAVIKLPGYLNGQAGPILSSAAPQMFRVMLSPLYVVTIRPEVEDMVAVQVFSEVVPEFPRLYPYSQWQPLTNSGATFLLTAGKYWCHIPRWNPLKLPDEPERADWLNLEDLNKSPAMLTRGCGVFVEFDVVNGPLTLKPKVVWPTGNAAITGTLKSDTGAALNKLRVVAIRRGPGFAGEIAATVSTDEAGAFAFKDLPAGNYLVQPNFVNDPHEPAAFAWASLQEDGTAHVDLVHGNAIKFGKDAPDCPFKFTILRNGRPVPDAVVDLYGVGRVETMSMDRPGHGTLGTSNSEGALEGRTRASGLRVLSVPSHSMKLFQAEIVEGRLTELTLELTEPGTGAIDASFEIANVQVQSLALEGPDIWRFSNIWRDEPGSMFQLAGIPPGKYRLVLRDEQYFEHVEEVEVLPDVELKLQRKIATHTLSVLWPALDEQTDLLDFALLHEGETKKQSPRRQTINRYGQSSVKDGIDLPAIAHSPHRVALYHHEHLLAFGDVGSDQTDVKPEDWVLVGTEDPANGGSIRVSRRINPERESRPYVIMEVSRSGVAPIQFEDGYLGRPMGEMTASHTFEGLRPGEWHIKVALDSGDTWEGDVPIEAGKTLDIELNATVPVVPEEKDGVTDNEETPAPQDGKEGHGKAPDPKKTDAHDRPWGGVEHKLPTPTGTTGPPPEPPSLPPTRPTPPPRLPPVPNRDEHRFGPGDFWYIEGASANELWDAIVHAKGTGLGVSSGVLGNTWNPAYYCPAVSLVRNQGRLALYVRGIRHWFTEVTLQVPGFKNAVWMISDNGDREIKLEPK